ncbi:phasin family protein [Oryzomonas rubra]|uniref:Phasin superfamily protein n=1 Tax=Oryzomonas rubra TaxID=2509454 RepID=A0A5A9XB07_9BACT|nr:phasin family protein [Oryzomonas rubra]KAA0888861.1 phasin superfamily protein [Oryzomonas rubra]
MLDLLEKTVMTAIGAAAITQKKAEELVNEMKEKYKVSEDEGRSFVDRVQGIAQESKDKIREMAETEVRKVVDKLGLVSRDEYERLVARVQELEARNNE